MSTAFIAGIGEHLPNATMTFDRYHLAAKLSEAVDQVRRTEVTTRPELTHTRWLWLKNWSNLSTTQRRELHRLMRPSAQLATARALRWREDFQAFYDQDPSYAPEYLRRWCYGGRRWCSIISCRNLRSNCGPLARPISCICSGLNLPAPGPSQRARPRRSTRPRRRPCGPGRPGPRGGGRGLGREAQLDGTDQPARHQYRSSGHGPGVAAHAVHPAHPLLHAQHRIVDKVALGIPQLRGSPLFR